MKFRVRDDDTGEFSSGPTTISNVLESLTATCTNGCSTPAPSSVSASSWSANTVGERADRPELGQASTSPTTAVSSTVQLNGDGATRGKQPNMSPIPPSTGDNRSLESQRVQLYDTHCRQPRGHSSEDVADAVALKVAVGLDVAVTVGDTVAVTVEDTVAVTVGDTVVVTDTVTVTVIVLETLAVMLGVLETVGVIVAVPETVAVIVAVTEALVEVVEVPDSVAVMVTVVETLPETDGVVDAVGVQDTVTVILLVMDIEGDRSVDGGLNSIAGVPPSPN